MTLSTYIKSLRILLFFCVCVSLFARPETNEIKLTHARVETESGGERKEVERDGGYRDNEELSTTH